MTQAEFNQLAETIGYGEMLRMLGAFCDIKEQETRNNMKLGKSYHMTLDAWQRRAGVMGDAYNKSIRDGMR